MRIPLVLIASLLCGCTTPRDRSHQVAADLQERTAFTPTTKTNLTAIDLPPGISLESAVTADQAVAIALWNNAEFQSALAELGIARAEVIRAGQLANPTFSVLFPAGPKQLEFAARFPVEAIWLRPRRIAIAEKDAAALAERIVEHGLNLVRDVRIACAEIESVRARAIIQQQAVALLDQLAKLADARVQAGDASELEATQSRADAAFGRQALTRMKADQILAEQRLGALLGLATHQTQIQLFATPQLHDAAQELPDLLQDALAARPELRAAELSLEAAAARVGLAKNEVFALSAVLDANGSGSNFEIGPGLEFPIPVLHQNQAARALADAQVAVAARKYIAARDRIAAEVRDAYSRLKQGQEQSAEWNRLIPLLESAARGAQKAYELGDVSRLAALDASRKVIESRRAELDSVAQQRRAFAELERAVGHRLTPKSNPD